jgi:hypothetical protein
VGYVRCRVFARAMSGDVTSRRLDFRGNRPVAELSGDTNR